jgi:hypothetical protein
MAETRVSIGQVKRDISDLVNRVAYDWKEVVYARCILGSCILHPIPSMV